MLISNLYDLLDSISTHSAISNSGMVTTGVLWMGRNFSTAINHFYNEISSRVVDDSRSTSIDDLLRKCLLLILERIDNDSKDGNRTHINLDVEQTTQNWIALHVLKLALEYKSKLPLEITISEYYGSTEPFDINTDTFDEDMMVPMYNMLIKH